MARRGSTRGTAASRLALPPYSPIDLPVIGVDPGGTTGLVVVSVPWGTMYDGDPYAGIKVHRYEQFTGPEEAQAASISGLVAAFADTSHWKIPVVVESFVLRKFSMDASLLSPVRMIEKIKSDLRAWDADSGLHQLFFQQPATAKRIVTDQRLDRWGLYVPGSEHARDALRHAVTLLRRCSEKESMRDLAWGEPAR